MLPAGTMVSGYRIEALRGVGGMGTVYEAHDESLDRTVALKVVAEQYGNDPNFRERFRRECHIQARLDHPHIVPIYAAGESEYGLWLAMRLVNGPTLREMLLSGDLEPERVLLLLTPVAQALDVAHEHGLIHRDVSPQNILVDERNRPYLSDFGITKAKGDRSLTKTGKFVGTLDYVSPEQIRDEPATATSDTYAFGAILFECLTGRVPFDKETDAAVLFAHVTEPPPAASAVRPSLPPALDPILERALAKEPDDRYGKASDLMADLGDALTVETESAAPVEAVAPVAPIEQVADTPSLTRRLKSFFSLCLLLIAAVMLGSLTSGGSEAAPERTVGGGGLAFDVPSGWIVQRRGRNPIEGLPLADPTVLDKRGGGAGAIAIGFSPATSETLLPVALQEAGKVRGGVPVALGELEALRYRGLPQAGSKAELAAFVVPTSRGVATVACRPDDDRELFRSCQEVAASLELTRGNAFPLGPSPRLAAALRRQLKTLGERRATLRKRLQTAGGASGQAAAASGLAAAFRRTARALAGLEVTPQSAAALAAFVTALRRTRDGYKSLATAAAHEDPARYEDATAKVTKAEGAVNRRLRALRDLGYRVKL
jgi:hypothetical protein